MEGSDIQMETMMSIVTEKLLFRDPDSSSLDFYYELVRQYLFTLRKLAFVMIGFGQTWLHNPSL